MVDLTDEILKIVELQLGKSQVLVTDQLVENLGAQSADVANLASALEDRYQVQVSETHLAQLHTVQDIVDLVVELRTGESE